MRHFIQAVLVCFTVAACSADDGNEPAGKGTPVDAGVSDTAGWDVVTGTGGAPTGDAALPQFYLDVTAPTEGQVHTQTGSPLEATVKFEVLAGPGIAKVEYVIETDFSLGESTQAPNFPLVYQYQYTGDRWTEARGFDADGNQVATDKVNFVVKAPTTSGPCLAQLDTLGVQYTPTVAKGVVDGVKLSGPLNGVLFAKTDTNTPSTDPMGCEFVLTLWKFAEVLKKHGFNKVGTLGSYCYRCCCSWSQTNYCRGPNDPEPNCSANGYSNHSFGRAMDIRYLYKTTGEVYDVNNTTHFKEWSGASSETCTSALAAQTGVSKELYTLICDQAAQQVFSICLTPNYNSAHRNHFHCDIGKSGPPGGFSVKSLPLPLVDMGDHPDSCGAEH
ncbi:MAG TPA: extensin family protein [Polyangiaceae bacterium]|nr:extensin family protein [Polyangiaceae bacterium]HMR75080.1 extensin family protein [Polyangiaceae bacterium]